MKDRFKPENLREAREARGMTMADLSSKCGVTRQAISLFENGSKAPGAETVFEISKALKIPISFLFNERPRYGQRSGPLNFRKFDSATKSSRAQASVMELWAADLYSYLSNFIEVPKTNIPFFRIDDFEQLVEDDIEWFASDTRKHWGLGNGPISNIRQLLENNGILVCRVPLGDRLDAYSCWRNERPTIVISNKIPHARSRFDLCHELGHLIMHRAVSDEHHQDKELFKKIETQAHLFAAAFLLPEQSFSKELYSISLSAFVELKKKWGVSIQAMVMRAYQLNLISENQKINLFRQISMLGYRKNEPLDKEMPVERPELFKRAIDLIIENKIMTPMDLLNDLSLSAQDLAHIAGVPEEMFHVSSSNVIPLKLKGDYR